MDRIRIRGGRPLTGEIPISGAKNAALPLMAASLLTSETLTLSNLPHLADISTLAHLLAGLGVEIGMNGDADNGGNAGRVLSLRAETISETTAPYDLVRRMRASMLVESVQSRIRINGSCSRGRGWRHLILSRPTVEKTT